jgi:hypothetical protein
MFEQNAPIWTEASNLAKNMTEPLTNLMENEIQRRYLFIMSALLHQFVKQKTVKEVKKQNLLEYQVRNNLKLSKNLNNDVNRICQGIYFLQELINGETVEGDNTKGLTPENLAMWIKDVKGLWPYSVHLYGLIFDAEKAQNVFNLVQEFDLTTFDKVQCLINGNVVKNDLGVPPKQIRFVIERALRW